MTSVMTSLGGGFGLAFLMVLGLLLYNISAAASKKGSNGALSSTLVSAVYGSTYLLASAAMSSKA